MSRYSRKKSSTLTMYCRVCSISTSVPVTTAAACVSCSKKSTVMKVAGLGSPMTALSISTPSRRSSKMFSPAPRSAMSDSSALLGELRTRSLDRTVRALVDVFDGPAAEQPAELGLQLLYLLLPAGSACSRAPAPSWYRSSLTLSARVFLHERRPEVGALMLLELEQLLRLLSLNLVKCMPRANP